jgi:hypothetical protein
MAVESPITPPPNTRIVAIRQNSRSLKAITQYLSQSMPAEPDHSNFMLTAPESLGAPTAREVIYTKLTNTCNYCALLRGHNSLFRTIYESGTRISRIENAQSLSLAIRMTKKG